MTCVLDSDTIDRVSY